MIRSVRSTELHGHPPPYNDTGETFACERVALAVVSQRLRSHGTGSQTATRLLLYTCAGTTDVCRSRALGARVGVLLAYASIRADEWEVMGVSATAQ